MSRMSRASRWDHPGGPPPRRGRLTAAQGTALYVTAVLGTGVIALPALAARVAGPASLVAWLLLVLMSAPLALSFAALGARHPDAGGVSTYARLAFGDRCAAVVGWCFYLAVPTGIAAAALFCGSYVAAAVGGGRLTTSVTAVVLVAVGASTNAFGLRLVGPVQLLLAALLVTLLILAVALSLPHASTDNLQPFAPHGWPAIGAAAAMLIWSFAGWEAITHLAGEFRHPERDIQRATWAAVVVVGLLYLLLALAVITVLGPDAHRGDAPLAELMRRGMGDHARPLAAFAAVLLTLGSANAYIAGAAGLGSALARHGALPSWLARGGRAGEVPRRSLAVVSLLTALSLGAVVVTGAGAEPLVHLTNGSLVAVYVAGSAAAVRLLPRGTHGHRAAVVSLVAVVLLLLASGPYLLWPLAVTAATLLYLRLRGNRPSIVERESDRAAKGSRAEDIRAKDS